MTALGCVLAVGAFGLVVRRGACMSPTEQEGKVKKQKAMSSKQRRREAARAGHIATAQMLRRLGFETRAAVHDMEASR